MRTLSKPRTHAALAWVLAAMAVAIAGTGAGLHLRLLSGEPTDAAPDAAAVDSLSEFLRSEQAILVNGVTQALGEDLCHGATPCNAIYDPAGATGMLVERCQKIEPSAVSAWSAYNKGQHEAITQALTGGCQRLTGAALSLGPYDGTAEWKQVLTDARNDFLACKAPTTPTSGASAEAGRGPGCKKNR